METSHSDSRPADDSWLKRTKHQIIQLLNMHIAQNLSKLSQLHRFNSEKTAAFYYFAQRICPTHAI